MKMGKRFVAILIVASLFVLVGCDSAKQMNQNPVEDDNKTIQRSELSPEELVTITLWLPSTRVVPTEDNKISELLLERLGVILEYEIVHPNEMHRHIGSRLARNDFLDLMGNIDTSTRLTTGGALLRLDEYLDTGLWPNLMEYVAPYRGRLSYHGAEVRSGLYVIPNDNRFYGTPIPTIYWGAGFWIQKSVLSYLDYPELTGMTLERYFDMIEIYMEAHPEINGMETIGFTFPNQRRVSWNMANPPMYLQGSANTGIVVIDENNEAHIYADSEYARRYLEILNSAYHRGLLDSEVFVQSAESYQEKLSSGNVLGMYDRRWEFRNIYRTLIDANKPERTWVPTMPTFDGHKPRYAERPNVVAGQGLGISATAKNPELLLTFLDTMLSEEWQIILSWGIKGEDFELDEKGLFFRNYEQRRNQWDEEWRVRNRLEALLEWLPKRQGLLSCGNAFLPSEQPSVFEASLTSFERDFLEATRKSSWHDFVNDVPENPVFFPVWDIPLGDNPEAHIAREELMDVTEEWMPILVKAPLGEFDRLWDEYVEAIQAINIQVFLDAINAGIQERIKIWGE